MPSLAGHTVLFHSFCHSSVHKKAIPVSNESDSLHAQKLLFSIRPTSDQSIISLCPAHIFQHMHWFNWISLPHDTYRYGANVQPCDGGSSPIIAILDKLLESPHRKSQIELEMCLKILLKAVPFIEMPYKVSERTCVTINLTNDLIFSIYLSTVIQTKLISHSHSTIENRCLFKSMQFCLRTGSFNKTRCLAWADWSIWPGKRIFPFLGKL